MLRGRALGERAEIGSFRRNIFIRDIWGGRYKVEEALKSGNKEIVNILFWPRGWSSPESPIEYQFQIKDEKIIIRHVKYRKGKNPRAKTQPGSAEGGELNIEE